MNFKNKYLLFLIKLWKKHLNFYVDSVIKNRYNVGQGERVKMLFNKHTVFTMGILGISLTLFSAPASAVIKLPPQDYVETVRAMDFYSNRIDDKFLSSLANEYKSYALFKANFTPDYKGANHFAVKAINAYHGEYVKPENVYNKNLPGESIVEISNYYDDLIHLLDTDLINQYPQLMAEAQAKFDCWVDSEANGLSSKQSLTCQNRFMKARKHLFAKLNDCNCSKSKNKKVNQKKTISKYDGKILPIPKWPNLPVVANNPPVPVIKHTVVRELTVSKEIKEAIVRIDKSIKEINTKLAGNTQTKADIDDIKKQIKELKNLISNSSQDDFVELKKKLSELEAKLSNISCADVVEEETSETETEPVEKVEEMIEMPEETADSEPENIIEETEDVKPTEEDEVLIYESESEDEPEEEDEEDGENDEEYFDEDEEEPEFEEVDEEEYIEVEVSNAPSTLLPYEIFFNWNDATVNPKFNTALKEIASNAKNSKEIIVIKGHTDASGTPEYNQKLSKKRAENVGKIIMSYGVPREKIILQGVGSTEPKVKTKVGEKNAENRRVVIK